MLTQHLLDCLSVVGPLQRALSEGSPPPTHQPVVLDVGSGAGLPGLVLALAWSALEVDLVEPVGKKAAFLRQSVSELGLVGRVRVHGCRIQEVKLPRVPDLAICRAFASLAEFVRLIAPLVAPSTRVFAMKGQRHEIEAEAAELAPPWQVVETVSLSVPGLDAARHLVRLGQHSESTHA
jgi:16S rRNA (guanine527-N7)-methyltransferase